MAPPRGKAPTRPDDAEAVKQRALGVFRTLADPTEHRARLERLERELDVLYDRWAWPPDGFVGTWPTPAAIAGAEEFARVLKEYERLSTLIDAESHHGQAGANLGPAAPARNPPASAASEDQDADEPY